MNGCAIPYTPIAVDFCKVRQCPRVKFFFLTHAYLDQTCGLSHSWSLPIYCSAITRNILISKFSIRPEIVHELELNVQHSIFLSNSEEDDVKVTLMDSNYCPGSVMFFFEGYFGRILYTGNFRFYEAIVTQTPLHLLLKKPVDVLYLDNTYCNSKCVFPTKESAQDIIRDIVEKHIHGKILIAIKSLGKEELLIYLSRYFSEKINVNEERLKVLDILKEDQNFTVNNIISARFDVIPFSDVFQKACHDSYSLGPSVYIVPTGLFTALGYNPFENQSNVFVIPYSNHSSYSELIKFVSIVHPKSIVPINKAVIDPVSGALMDRTNIDCFQDYLDKSPMHHYHIPQSVLKVMNQSSVPKSKRLSKSSIKKARKRSEPIYLGIIESESRDKEMHDDSTRRGSVPKYLLAPTFNKNSNETLSRYALDKYASSRRVSVTEAKPVKTLKRCKSLDSFNVNQDYNTVNQCQQANLVDLNVPHGSIVSNINFYPMSNLVRCHRARLCIPEQCRTVCHSKNVLECTCHSYLDNVIPARKQVENVSSQLTTSNCKTQNIHSSMLYPDQIKNMICLPDKLICKQSKQFYQPGLDYNINNIDFSNMLSIASHDSNTRSSCDMNSDETNYGPPPKIQKLFQEKSDEAINELPPKKKWCNQFNISQLSNKVSSENKCNFRPQIRRRLGTTANPMDICLNSIAKVPTTCLVSNSNYRILSNVGPTITSTSRSAMQKNCENLMKVMYFNSQCSVNSQNLRQSSSPIDLSVSKA